jgi:hypothetical protein
MWKDYFWAILCGILVSALALAIFEIDKPAMFYQLFKELGINWVLIGVWIDMLLGASYTYLAASAIVVPIAILTYKRSPHLANIAGAVVVILYVLLLLVANSRSQIAWRPFNIFYFTTLYICECVVIFFIVSLWAKFGYFLRQYLTRSFKRSSNSTS